MRNIDKSKSSKNSKSEYIDMGTLENMRKYTNLKNSIIKEESDSNLIKISKDGCEESSINI